VKFGRQFVGYIHKDHLSAPWDIPQDYSVGDDLLARVLYVLPTVKFVYLSLKKELCDPEANSAPSASVKIGSIVEEAKVRDFDVLMAVYMQGHIFVNYCIYLGSLAFICIYTVSVPGCTTL
jgi:hypothetical protein